MPRQRNITGRQNPKEENSKKEVSPQRGRRKGRQQSNGLSSIVFLFIGLPMGWFLSKVASGLINSSVYPHAAVVSTRFPLWGSPEFEARCRWALQASALSEEGNVVHITSFPESHEGLSEWVSALVSGRLFQELLHSEIQVEFPFVNLAELVEPVSPNVPWKLVNGTTCSKQDRCMNVYGHPSERQSFDFEGEPLPWVPIYRHASKLHNARNRIVESDYGELHRRIPGFGVADGFACAFQSLIRLSESATKYEPTLFTEILPAMRNPQALVLTLYIRTGFTEGDALEINHGPAEPTRTTIKTTECALELEKTHAGPVTWLVLSDSTSTKEWVASTYNSGNRQVLVTHAQGKHSRPEGSPTTSDFADGFIDWYLMGESNAVITNNAWYSYGFTGALRTSRPLYEGGDEGRCLLVQWLL
eukprot:Nitzschia sp. Nitz4//scaffold57_size113557//10202//11452//NITZ4_003980-RA/size113557-processed-gene-0.150-mRNA-1//-1//CDS//3329554813//2326//frame0